MSEPDIATEPFLIDGEWIAARRTHHFDVVDPGRRGALRARDPGLQGRRRRRRRRRAAAHDGRPLAQPRPRRSHPRPDPDRRADRGAARGARGAGDARQRQADRALARRHRDERAAPSATSPAPRPGSAGRPSRCPGYHVYTTREPVGVVGSILPWNFPLMTAGWKLAPALAAGCTVVVKPAEQTPMTALRLGALICEAGRPGGVVNVVPGVGEGGRRAGRAPRRGQGLLHRLDRGRAAGDRRRRRRRPKRVTLELGGKTPEHHLRRRRSRRGDARRAMRAFFGQLGPDAARRAAGCRRSGRVHDEMRRAASPPRCRKVPMGDPVDGDTSVGPLVSEEQRERVLGYIDAGRAGGRRAGGRRRPRRPTHGYFVEPTLFTGVDNEMRIAREEIFGPVVGVIPFDDVEEAIAHRQRHRLRARRRDLDPRRHERPPVAAELEVGTVWVNTYNSSTRRSSFGGSATRASAAISATRRSSPSPSRRAS